MQGGGVRVHVVLEWRVCARGVVRVRCGVYVHAVCGLACVCTWCRRGVYVHAVHELACMCTWCVSGVYVHAVYALCAHAVACMCARRM